MTYQVPGTLIKFRQSDRGGMEVAYEKSEVYYLTFRTLDELLDMHPSAILIEGQAERDTDNEDAERELFGETLDEPIPDDLWELLRSI